jgi:hypothetical protein
MVLNLVLFVLVIGFGVFFWLVPNQAESVDTVSQLRPADINRIEIHQAGAGQTIILQREAVGWSMLQPVQESIKTRVNENRVKHLMTLLNEPVETRLPKDGYDLQAFELDETKLEVRFNDERIRFGMQHPMSYKRYLLKDNEVLLANETVFNTLSAEVASFYAPRLLPEGATVEKLVLPEAYEPNAKAIQQWQALEAMYVTAWNDEHEPSSGQVELHLNNGNMQVFEIISTVPEFWVGNVALKAKYHIPEADLANLLPPK